MHLLSLTLTNFRCFGEDPVTVTFRELTAFVGTNGAGKTATLIALARMFGSTSLLRTLVKEDFHRDGIEDAPDELSMSVEARFEFPELLDDDDAKESSAVPQALRNIIAEGGDGAPQARIRLDATWKNTASAEGDITSTLSWISTLDDAPDETAFTPLDAFDRSLVQVLYVPAARDAGKELRAASGTILSRVLRHVDWGDELRERLETLADDMSTAVRDQPAMKDLEERLRVRWKKLAGSGGGKPELTFAETSLETLLRRLDARVVDGKSERSLELLSEGERSLMHLALVSSALAFESDFVAKQPDVETRLPALTILAVEEPENHLAPHYLSRIVALLRQVNSNRNAQAVITSHSASILRRLDPAEVRHFRVDDDGDHCASEIDMPDDADEAFRYVREAVQSHPELYFARVVVLGEGPTEQVVLPRIAKVLGLDVDPQFVAVVPLGGRHVHHFWRLLTAIGTPFVTLLDLDNGRPGAGWGRINTSALELLENGSDEATVLYPGSSIGLVDMEKRAFERHDTAELGGWLTHFEKQHDVFFSAPLDLDLTMLAAFHAEFVATVPKNGGPRLPADKEKLAVYMKGANNRVLGAGGDSTVYGSADRDLFPLYAYLFVDGSKPTAHAKVLAGLADDVLAKKCPDVLKRLVTRLLELVGS